jgi:hypothetical protein
MRRAVFVMLLAMAGACRSEAPETGTVTADETQDVAQTAETAPATATGDSYSTSTWSAQLKVDNEVSTLNYVGEESGDWAPIRFRNDSEAGKKILAACRNDDLCEFTGVVEWLAEIPPENASAVGQLIRVDSVKRLPPEP